MGTNSPRNYYLTMTGSEILFGPLIEQTMLCINKIPTLSLKSFHLLKTLLYYLKHLFIRPFVVWGIIGLFITSIWGGYIFFMKESPEWFVNLLPRNIASQTASTTNEAKIIDYAQLGDSYGFVNTLFAGLALLGIIITLHQQNKSIKLQIQALNDQSNVNKAHIHAIWMQDTMTQLSQLSKELELVSVSYTPLEGVYTHVIKGRDAISLFFESACQACTFKFGVNSTTGNVSEAYELLFWTAFNIYSRCLLELSHFWKIRSNIVNRIQTCQHLTSDEKDQLMATIPFEHTKELILLRAVMNSNDFASMNHPSQQNEHIEHACMILLPSIRRYMYESKCNVCKKQQAGGTVPFESEISAANLCTNLNIPELQNLLEQVIHDFVTNGCSVQARM